MRQLAFSARSAFVGATLLATPLLGQLTITEEAELPVFGIYGHDTFGAAVSLSGDWAIAGSGDFGTGKAFVFERTPGGWIQHAKLEISDPTQGDSFGHAVALDGSWAVVGAPDHDDRDDALNSGSAYIFQRTPSGWKEEAKLVAPDGAAFDQFGIAVSISSDTALVGTRWGDGAETDSGCAYVFERQGADWVFTAKLAALDGDLHEAFGTAVSLSGDVALIGAYGYTPFLFGNVGAAYVFERTPGGWVERQKLIASDSVLSTSGESFGYSVSIAGERAIVGAPWAGTTDKGSAYVFERTPGGWVEQAHLLPPAGVGQNDLFGYTVSIAGDLAVAGAWIEDLVFVYGRSQGAWLLQAKALQAVDTSGGFGKALSVSGERFLVGAPGTADLGTVYDFFAPGGSCTPRSGLLGLNPADYTCTTEPHVGGTWLAAVGTAPLLGDATAATLLTFGMGGATQGLTAFGFELLVLPPYPSVLLSATGSHSVAIPAQPSLVGAAIATQGGRIETSPTSLYVVLTNAQDVILGLF